MLKVLVTGGAGFIGSHLAEELIRNKFEVIVVDDLSSGQKKNLPKAAVFKKMDIRSPKLIVLLKKIKPDYVCHLAAQVSAPKSIVDPALDASINISGTLNLIKACQGLKLKKFLFVSTAGVYGDNEDLPTDELVKMQPLNPYSFSKLSVENFLHYFKTDLGWPTVVTRLSNVYGPRQKALGEGGVVAIFSESLLKGQDLNIQGRGFQTRDFIYVVDVAKGLSQAMLHGQGVYNLSTGRETSLLQLLQALGEVLAVVPKVKYVPPRLGDVPKSCLKADKARRQLSWRAEVPLTEGLRRTLLWFKKSSIKK
ncbi:NAD-dependent epimerase/dehydratase family protein [Patescibacteria group bacterium]|nr:NAD-dependent epimerase/dehydratase family protein [Patescibacteria group bacterium]